MSATSLTLEKVRDLLEKELSVLFKAKTPLCVAARYALKEGKRLRPLLFLAVALGYGVPIETALQPACAWELVHTYSLIHDDLPCMDDDDQRRGRPTLHRAFSEWQAILTGDFLLTYAFELLSTAQSLTDAIKIELVSLLARSSGGEGMVEGQLLDLSLAPEETTWPLLKKLHQKKTGALFSSALEAGASLAGASFEERKAFSTLGRTFGLAYQIADDLRDFDSKAPSALRTLGEKKAKIILKKLKVDVEELFHSLTLSMPLLQELLAQMSPLSSNALVLNSS